MQVADLLAIDPFIRKGPLDRFFGLYCVKSRKEIPLKEIKIDAFLNENFARVKYSQVYTNDSDNMLETEYFFPISSTACYDSFKANVSGRVIEGVIKEKQQAQKEYKEHVEKGDTVAYAEINKETHDIMKVLIGNIPPNSSIDIEFSYIDKIDVSMNKFRKFTLYSTLTPRYNSNSMGNKDVETLASYPLVPSVSKDSYPWNISISIACTEAITFLKSPSHPDVKITNPDSCLSVVEVPCNKYRPNKDFTLLFQCGNPKTPHYSISPFQYGYCALVNFFPEINNSVTLDDAFLAASQGKDLENADITRAKGEFIFLLDRSGSMEGTRIKKAKEALIYFLKSLPEDSYFNVVSFGSEFFLLNFESSIKNSETELEKAIETIQDYRADLGGTEILEPLQYLETMPLRDGYPRAVFLLTDGAVSNTDQVLKIIEKNKDKSRVFSLGVGDGCSTDLIKNSAAAGRGRYEFVADKEIVSNKIIFLLKNSITPYITDFSLVHENSSLVAYTVPDPKTVEFIVPNQLCEFLIVFNKKLKDQPKTSVTLKYYNGVTCSYEETTIQLELNRQEEDLALVKYGMFKFCKALQKKDNAFAKGVIDFNDDVAKALNTDVSNQLVNVSLKYGILTEKTAFLCVVREGDDISKQIPTEKIVVPVLASADYEEEDEVKPDIYAGGLQRGYKQQIPQPNMSPVNSFSSHSSKSFKSQPQFSNMSQGNMGGNMGFGSYQQPPHMQVQQQMYQNLSKMLEQQSELESLETKSAALQNQSKAFYKSAEKSSTGGFMGGISNAFNSVSNSFSNMFSSKDTKPKHEEEFSDFKSAPRRRSSKESENKEKKMKQMKKAEEKESYNFDEEFTSNKKQSDSRPASSQLESFDLLSMDQPISPKLSQSNQSANLFSNFSYDPSNEKISDHSTKADLLGFEDFQSAQTKTTITNAKVPVSKSKLTEIIMKQKISGFWEANSSSAQIMNVDHLSLLSKLPSKLSGVQDSSNIWWTILILVWIEVNFPTMMSSWELIHKKASQWLSNKSVDYKEYYQDAKTCLNL